MVSVLLKQSVCYLLIQLPTFVKRELFALITFAALVTFGYVMRPSSLRDLSVSQRRLRALTGLLPSSPEQSGTQAVMEKVTLRWRMHSVSWPL